MGWQRAGHNLGPTAVTPRTPLSIPLLVHMHVASMSWLLFIELLYPGVHVRLKLMFSLCV